MGLIRQSDMKNKSKSAKGSPKAESNRSGLMIGDVIKFNGSEHVVWFVNDSRAAVAELKSPIKFRVRDSDGKFEFLAKESENISPNSDCEVLRSLGRKGLAAYLEQTAAKKNQNNSRTDMAKDKSTKSTTKSEKEKTGKLGGYKGHSITSVIRAFGKVGYTLDEARAWFAKKDIAVADATIKIQLRAGSKGEGGDPAPISKEDLLAMKPKVKAPAKAEKTEKKPAKKSKTTKPAKEESLEEEATKDLEETQDENGEE